jgi:hypothetical protein
VIRSQTNYHFSQKAVARIAFFGFAFFTADFIGERKKVEGGIKNSSLASGW